MNGDDIQEYPESVSTMSWTKPDGNRLLAAGASLFGLGLWHHERMKVLHHQATNSEFRKFQLEQAKIEKIPAPVSKECEYVPVKGADGKMTSVKKVCTTYYKDDTSMIDPGGTLD